MKKLIATLLISAAAVVATVAPVKAETLHSELGTLVVNTDGPAYQFDSGDTLRYTANVGGKIYRGFATLFYEGNGVYSGSFHDVSRQGNYCTGTLYFNPYSLRTLWVIGNSYSCPSPAGSHSVIDLYQ